MFEDESPFEGGPQPCLREFKSPGNANAGRDHPLTCHFTVTRDQINRLRLPPAGSKRLETVRDAIIAEVMLAHCCGKRVNYSRSNDFYPATRRYRSRSFTKTTILSTIDQLLEQNLIAENRAKPGDHRRTGRQSTIWATDKLIELWDHGSDTRYTYDPHEVIRLKRPVAKPVGYDDTEEWRWRLASYNETDECQRCRRRVQEYNEALKATDIILQADDVEWRVPVVRVPTKTSELLVLPYRKAGYRVFNGDFRHGGRFYGPFWQSLPKERRQQLLINGSPVAEPDHRQLHPRLLYAEFGLRVDGDAYTVSGYEKRRKLFKVAFQIMINASSHKAGMWALAEKLAERVRDEDRVSVGPQKLLRDAAGILNLLEERHASIKDAFYTGVGLRLQRTDSDMAMRLVSRLLKRGIVTAAVHDSFVVQIHHRDITAELMAEELDRATR